MPIVSFMSLPDLHLSLRPLGRRTHAFKDQISSKLQQCSELCALEKVDFVIFPGDIFNDKYGFKIPHALVNLFLYYLNQFPSSVQFVAVAGNHDLAHHTLKSLQSHPLGILSQFPRFHLLGEAESLILSANGASVNFYGVPFTPTVDKEEGKAYVMESIGTADFGVVVCHGSLISDVEEFFAEHTHFGQVAPKTKALVTFGGHIHTPKVPLQETDGKYFFNHGSITRNTYDQAQRHVFTDLVRVETPSQQIEIHAIKLKVKYGEEAFLLEDFNEEQAGQGQMQEFVESLAGKVSSTDLNSREDLLSRAFELAGDDAEVRQKLEFYLTSAT